MRIKWVANASIIFILLIGGNGILKRQDCLPLKQASTKGNNPYPTIAVIDKMDELLTDEQKLAVMEPEGCCKGGKRDADCKAFDREHKHKTFAEKLALMFSVEYMMNPC
jgi:hypothetical protein